MQKQARGVLRMSDRPGQQAIVVGGSIAGLITARVLSDYFEQVLVKGCRAGAFSTRRMSQQFLPPRLVSERVEQSRTVTPQSSVEGFGGFRRLIPCLPIQPFQQVTVTPPLSCLATHVRAPR